MDRVHARDSDKDADLDDSDSDEDAIPGDIRIAPQRSSEEDYMQF